MTHLSGYDRSQLLLLPEAVDDCFRVPEKSPRTVCCQPITLATSSTVAPAGRCSIAITASCFDGRFVSDGWSGSGKASIADHS